MTYFVRQTVLTLSLAFFPSVVLQADDVDAAGSAGKSVFLIGNSLTWDTVPSKLDGDVQWHVDCGKSLPYIFENPKEPCVKTSTLWPEALTKKQYDIISFQPHYGSTMQQDVDVISRWLEMQPKAEVVIHTGWARQHQRTDEYASTDTSGVMTHSPAYITALIETLQDRYPDRVFRQTHAIDLIHQVASDVDSGSAPFDDVAELHRDTIHMHRLPGRYLMHNAMRHAVGQPASADGYDELERGQKRYLDSVLGTLPPINETKSKATN